MFKIIPGGPNRIDMELSGKLECEDMSQALDEFLSLSEGISHGKMLCRISNFDLPSLGAIGVELVRLPKMFKLISKFDRAAVLADENWIRKISEIEGVFFPGLDIRAFGLAESAEAEEWLNT